MRRGKVIFGTETALVTGASSGIGREYAIQLASRGYNVVLVSRDMEGLKETEKEILDTYHSGVTLLEKDLATPTAAEELYSWVKEKGIEVSVLVNNAGIFSFCDICSTPDDRIRQILYLHDMTNTLMCKYFAEDMARRGGGYILNMSSFSIWMPFPGLTLYSASKAYLKSFSVAFAKEVKEKKVYVTAVCPAGIATDLYGLPKKLQKLGLALHALSTPKFCARRGLRCLFRHRRCIVPDWWNRLFIPFCLCIPGFAMKWLRKYTAKFQK